MDIITDDLMSKTAAFQLKGSLFTLTALQLQTTHLEKIQEQLTYQIQRSPAFFKNAPVIIELQEISEEKSLLNFIELIQLLKKFNLIPVGVRGGNDNQTRQAIDAGLGVLATTRALSKSQTIKKQTLPQGKSKIVTQPVRSGQQVVAKGGDLIVIAPVSAGAELMSDGNIHVYGPLRGRALAGVSGDKSARIFCKNLAAELVSIAGHYWVSEDLKVPFDREGVQVYLEDDRLRLGLL